MIGRLVLGLALVAGVGASSAQQPVCSLYKVNTSLLNVSKDAGGGIYIDVLEDGEIACVTRQQKVKGADWGFIAHRVAKPDKRTPVGGWSALNFLKKLSPAEAAAFGGAAPATAAAAAPKSAAPPPVAAASPPAPPAVRPEDTLHFNQPVPFGPYPVNGNSLKKLAEGNPLFPPIVGLDEALWKKKMCTTCHKWNQARLCAQGKTYAKTPRYALRHQHPYGGAYKIALMRWSKSGCK